MFVLKQEGSLLLNMCVLVKVNKECVVCGMAYHVLSVYTEFEPAIIDWRIHSIVFRHRKTNSN